MNFTFLTRCSRPDNIDKVKKSIADVFTGVPQTYRHIILADLTHGTDRQLFDGFRDDHTSVFYVEGKNADDSQCTEGMDRTLAQLEPIGEDYIYILDDDNLLHPEFLNIVEDCDGSDAVVFRIVGRPTLGTSEIMFIYPVGHIDWANYVTKLETMKRIKVYHLDGPRRCEDGVFFDHLKRENCTIKFVNKEIAYYNALR